MIIENFNPMNLFVIISKIAPIIRKLIIDQKYDCFSLMKIFIKACRMMITEQVRAATNIRSM